MEDFSLNKILVIIIGPTAIGKTDVAIELAKYFQTEIISADSRQFYKDIQIGTAKPTADEMQGIRHHFIDSLELDEYYSVYEYEKEVLKLLENLFKRYNIVVMVGGSGLYIDAVCKGIDELPDADEKIRNELKEKFDKEGIEYLQQEVKRLDPDYFETVDQNNPSRLMRAIEVCRIMGMPFSKLRKSETQKRDFNILKAGLNTDREILFNRINTRVDIMMEAGLLDEVKKVYKFKDLNSLNTVGYKELFQYLDGKESLEWAVGKIKTNTRRYAKRQMTWFNKDRDIKWFRPNELDEIIEFVVLSS